MSNLILRPTADGNYTSWSGFSLGVPHTPLYDLIDESDYVVGTGDDDYISTSAANAFTVLLSDTAAGSWPRASRVCSIRVVAVVRQTGSSCDFSFRLRSVEHDLDSPVHTLTSTTYTEVGYTFNLGLNSYAWDVQTLNQLEAGLVFSSGDELRCTKLEVYVHTEPFPHHTLLTEADGALQAWSPVPSSSPAYMTVGGVYDGDLSYLSDSTVNNQSTFVLSDLPTTVTPANIDRVDVKALVKNVGSAVKEADVLLRSATTVYYGGTNTTSTPVQPDGEWHLLTESYLNDPNVAWPSGHPSATAWTISEVNGLQVGVDNSGGGDFRCTSLAAEVWLTPTPTTSIDLFPTANGYHQDWGSVVGAASAWQAVDEDPPDNATSYITLDSDTLGISAYSSFDVGGAGSIPAGERVFSVEARYRIRLDNLPHSSALVAPVVRDTSGSESYVGRPQLIEGMASTWFDVKWDFNTNPHTGNPWADLAEVTGYEYGFVVLSGAVLLSRVRTQVHTVTDFRSATVDPIDAKITDAATTLIARSKTDGTIYGVVEFSVGTGGYDTTDPSTVTIVNPADTALSSELYRASVGRIEYDSISVIPTVDYWCRVPREAAQGGLGELGLWAEIFWSPIPSEIGTKFLFALAHHPIQARHADGVQFCRARLVYWDLGAELLADRGAESIGTQLLADGDMEAIGTAAWTPVSSAVLTKQPGSPSGVGTQVLRVAYGGTVWPYARQIILTSGLSYRIQGWGRGDGGTAPPVVRCGSTNVVWTGTSSATWQQFDVLAIASNSFFALQNQSGGGYVEFDDVVITNACSDWTPNNNALLSKETTSPYTGLQVLRITYTGTANPEAYQNILTAGHLYRVTGHARSDGTFLPVVLDGTTAVWTGTSSTLWQDYDEMFISSGVGWLVFRAQGAVAGYAEFDEMSAQEILTYDFLINGAELLADGDMETAGVAAWTVGNSATLTKQTTSPYEGTQVLRVAYNAVANPYASQSVMTPGTIYRVQGVMRSDGTGVPEVYDGATMIWQGVSTTSAWQSFDVAIEAANADIRFQCTIAGAGYCEVDAVSVKELSLP